MIKRPIFEAWHGSLPDAYWGNFEKGEWKRVWFIRYLFLLSFGYIVRVRWVRWF